MRPRLSPASVTAFREDETVTVDGTKYQFARNEDGTAGFVDGITSNFDFDKEYTIYLTADGYVIGVEGAAGADLSDVYYVAGVYWRGEPLQCQQVYLVRPGRVPGGWFCL